MPTTRSPGRRATWPARTSGAGRSWRASTYSPSSGRRAWNWPDGFNGNDQRHKLRAFASYGLPLSPAIGQFTVGAVQRFDSGTPYDMNISVDSRPYVTGTPYLKAPASVGYYLTGRGALRWDNTWTTDLSLNWSKKLAGINRALLPRRRQQPVQQPGAADREHRGQLGRLAGRFQGPRGVQPLHDGAGRGRRTTPRIAAFGDAHSAEGLPVPAVGQFLVRRPLLDAQVEEHDSVRNDRGQAHRLAPVVVQPPMDGPARRLVSSAASAAGS